MDLSGKKWPVFKRVLEERFDGESGVPNIKNEGIDRQWQILYEHVREMVESSAKDAAKAKQKKWWLRKKEGGN